MLVIFEELAADTVPLTTVEPEATDEIPMSLTGTPLSSLIFVCKI